MVLGDTNKPVIRIGASADRSIRYASEAAAAALMAAEVILLGSSVVARYVYHRPLLWSDELAATLFLWLAMVGAAVAVRRGEHLRLTALITAVPASTRAFIDAATSTLMAMFALALAVYGLEYAQDELFVTSPGLGISNFWRTSAISVGGLLMAEAILARWLSGAFRGSQLLLAVAVVGAISAALWLAGDGLAELENWNLLIFFVLILSVCMLMGLPIAFAFGLTTLAYLVLTTGAPPSVVMARMDGGMSNIILLSIPLFVFLGKLMEATGMAEALVKFIAMLVGHLRGGLSYTLLAAMYVVSGISGAKTADMAAVAPVLFPEMRRRGAQGGELVSLLAASAVMSETIPPSLVLIAIATTVGVSIAALFTAGLIPALVAAVALCCLVYYRSRGERPARRSADRRAILWALVAALPGLVLPFVIRAAVVEGVATATEVSTVGIAYTFVAGLLLRRGFPWRALVPMLVDTAVMSGALLLILGAASAMAWALTQSGFSDQLATALTHMPGGKAGFLAVAIVMFVVFGSVLEGLPAIALFGPLLFPIARTLGIHDVHFAMVAILAMGLGLYMPPFGVGYYSACAIGGVSPDEGMRRIWPYLALLLCAVLVIAAVPWFSTGLLGHR